MRRVMKQALSEAPGGGVSAQHADMLLPSTLLWASLKHLRYHVLYLRV